MTEHSVSRRASVTRRDTATREDAQRQPGKQACRGAKVLTEADTRLAAIITEQEEIFTRRQPRSAEYAAAASSVLAGGVTSNWQITQPQPVWLSHGRGGKVYDVDGNEYVDLHGGYGAALAGHAHPAIVQAVRSQAALGTHFAQPTPPAIPGAEELTRRFGVPPWPVSQSGSAGSVDTRP